MIQLAPTEEQFPGVIGLYCEQIGDKTQLAIALPKRGEWLNSTLFETMGKGEAWKVYDLTESQMKSGKVIGSFEFLIGEKTYKYDLTSIFKIARETPTKKINNEYKVIVGTADLSVSSDAEDGSEGSFVVGGRILTRPSLLNLRFGLDVNIAQALSESEDKKALTYKEFRVHTGYRFFEESSFNLDPRFYVVFSDASNPNTGLKMTHQQMGYGLEMRWWMTESMGLRLAYVSSGFASSDPVSNTSIQAELIYQLPTWSIGLGYEANSYVFETEDDGDAEFAQNLIYLSIGF